MGVLRRPGGITVSRPGGYPSGSWAASYLDLVLVVVAVLFTITLAFISGRQGVWEFVRVPLGFLFAFFLPGYAITAALYPSSTPEWMGQSSEEPPTLQATERLVMSVGLSIAVVPLIGLFWNFTPWGIDVFQILSGIAVVTVVATLLAGYRRWTIPPSRRFRIEYLGLVSALRTAHRRATPKGRVLNVVIAVLLVTSVVGLSVAIGFPGDGERYTELYVLTADEETGQLTASDYPTNFTVGESKPVVVGVGNHEQRRVEYTVLVVLHRVEQDSGTAIVTESIELDRFEFALGRDETDRRRHEIRPTFEGQNLRLAFLLYKGDPPANPTLQNAYRQVHIWISVHESD